MNLSKNVPRKPIFLRMYFQSYFMTKHYQMGRGGVEIQDSHEGEKFSANIVKIPVKLLSISNAILVISRKFDSHKNMIPRNRKDSTYQMPH
jgi:hypothetical protein